MNPNPQLPAYVRTYIPLLVVLLGRELSKHGFNVDNELLNVVVGIVVGAAYYAIIRALEAHKAQFGWLLGVAKQPAYLPGPAPKPETGEDVVAVVEPDFDEDVADAVLRGEAPPKIGD